MKSTKNIELVDNQKLTTMKTLESVLNGIKAESYHVYYQLDFHKESDQIYKSCRNASKTEARAMLNKAQSLIKAHIFDTFRIYVGASANLKVEKMPDGEWYYPKKELLELKIKTSNSAY